MWILGRERKNVPRGTFFSEAAPPHPQKSLALGRQGLRGSLRDALETMGAPARQSPWRGHFEAFSHLLPQLVRGGWGSWRG